MSDLIDRQAAIDAVSSCGICIQKVVDIPTIEAEPVRNGTWTEAMITGYRCSNCKMIFDFRMRYCGHCGARMDKRRYDE